MYLNIKNIQYIKKKMSIYQSINFREKVLFVCLHVYVVREKLRLHILVWDLKAY